MKLPDIEYGPVQESSSALARVDEAGRRAAGVFAEGLGALAREMVKTQAERASVDLEAALADREEFLAKNPYVSTKYLREQLGPDFDSLDPNLKKELTSRVKDPVTGEVLDVDKEQVPTWLVAGPLFEKWAKTAVQGASQRISAPGWRSEFELAAQQDLVRRRARLGLVQAHAMIDDQKREQKATVDQLARLGQFDRALDTIETSKAFQPGEKAVLREEVLAKRQGATADALLAQADALAEQLEAKHANDPQGAMKAAQGLGGVLGPKVATRLNERARLREEAENDKVKVLKGGLELGIRASKILTVGQLERFEDYKALPQWAQADLVAILNDTAEHRLRLSQLTSETQWKQELERYQGLSDREKVKQWPSYQEKVPFAFAGGFAQTYEAARVRLEGAWDSEDVQKTFDLAAGTLKWTGPRAPIAAKLKDRGRRWYDAETRRNKGVPPTSAEAAKWLAENLMLGDENGESWGGGNQVYRFQAEEIAEKKGEPVRFEPFSPERQKYGPAAVLLRQPAPAPEAAPPAPAAAPASEPKVGDRRSSDALGLPAGGVLEYLGKGKWKRVQ